jgi:chromosome segregation ATPase
MLVAADVALKAAEVERGQLRLDLAEALLHLDECHQRRKAEGEQLRQELHNTQARMKEAQEEVEQLRLKLSDAEQQASNAITWQQAMVRAEGENRLLRAALGDDDGCGGDWLKGRAEKVLGKEVPS